MVEGVSGKPLLAVPKPCVETRNEPGFWAVPIIPLGPKGDEALGEIARDANQQGKNSGHPYQQIY